MGQGASGESPLQRLYPETAAGGYPRNDGFIDFYQRVNALLEDGADVLDVGAGRGSWADDPALSPAHRRLRDLGARAGLVAGADVDPVVLDNPTLDKAAVFEPGDPLPFDDACFDLAVADHVLEHVLEDDAPALVSELHRVLRPGGWFAARTPNKWGVIGVGARAVPNRMHVGVLRRLQPGRQAEDVFPTAYSMNTRRDLRTLFDADRWRLAVYPHTSAPQYAGRSVAAWRMFAAVDRVTPSRMAPTLMVFAQRRGA